MEKNDIEASINAAYAEKNSETSIQDGNFIVEIVFKK